MTSQPEKHSKVPRRAVLGTAVGEAAAAALPGTAHAVQHEQPVPSDDERGRPWRLRNRVTTDGAWAGRVPARPGPAGHQPGPLHGPARPRPGHRPEFGSGWGTCRLPVVHLMLLDDGSPARTQDLGDGTLAIDLPRGREVLVHSGTRPDLVIEPVAVCEPGPAWGLP